MDSLIRRLYEDMEVIANLEIGEKLNLHTPPGSSPEVSPPGWISGLSRRLSGEGKEELREYLRELLMRVNEMSKLLDTNGLMELADRLGAVSGGLANLSITYSQFQEMVNFFYKYGKEIKKTLLRIQIRIDNSELLSPEMNGRQILRYSGK